MVEIVVEKECFRVGYFFRSSFIAELLLMIKIMIILMAINHI